MERLQRIPYFSAAYHQTDPPLVSSTASLCCATRGTEFREATDKMVALATQAISAKRPSLALAAIGRASSHACRPRASDALRSRQANKGARQDHMDAGQHAPTRSEPRVAGVPQRDHRRLRLRARALRHAEEDSRQRLQRASRRSCSRHSASRTASGHANGAPLPPCLGDRWSCSSRGWRRSTLDAQSAPRSAALPERRAATLVAAKKRARSRRRRTAF
jgi:hypothetical protein